MSFGVADPSVDADTADDVLFGPLIYRLMSGHKPLTEAEADLISSAALNGLRRADRNGAEELDAPSR